MPGDSTARLAAPVRALLRDGETVRCAAPLVADPGTAEDVSIPDELANLLDPTMLLGLGTHPGELGRRLLYGRGVVGDGLARTLFVAIESAHAPRLAITDRRLLVVDVTVTPRGSGLLSRWFGAVDETGTLVFEADRALLMGAVPAPAGALRRGRFIVAFVDGSGCAVVCAVPGHAAQAVAVVGPPAVEGKAQ